MNLTAWLMIGTLLVSTVGGLWILRQNSKIETLETKLAVSEASKLETEKALKSVQEQARIQAENLIKLDSELRDAEAYSAELRNLFQEHNLTKLAEEKPKLIEERINSGTRDIFNSIEQFTRSR